MTDATTADDDFRAFAETAIPMLHRTALAACGDRHRADDLVQTALEKLFVSWPRIRREARDPLAYARTTVVRSLIDDARRPFWRREVRSRTLPETGGVDEAQRAVDRDWVRSALDDLTPRQRLAVVLRHLEGLSVQECARAIGTSETNVKAATREGMAALRSAADRSLGEGAER